MQHIFDSILMSWLCSHIFVHVTLTSIDYAKCHTVHFLLNGAAVEIYVGDTRDAENIIAAFQDIDALTILTSAMPRIKPGFKQKRPKYYIL